MGRMEKGGPKTEYLKAKREAKRAVYLAKKEASEHKFSNLNDYDKLKCLFKTAHRMKGENHDIVGTNASKTTMGILHTMTRQNSKPGGSITKGCLMWNLIGRKMPISRAPS